MPDADIALHPRWTPDRVRALRERLDLDQAAFAEVLGFKSRVRISEIENAKRFVTEQAGYLLDYIDRFGVLEPQTSDSDETA